MEISSSIFSEVERRRNRIKPLNERIKRLREFTEECEVRVSVERAKLITEFYRSSLSHTLPIPIQRALAFKYLMENVSVPIEPGQLIVGIRGSGVKEVPTYPEITLHTIEDLKTLNERNIMPSKVSEEVIRTYEEEIIPFWKGKSIRDILFQACLKNG